MPDEPKILNLPVNPEEFHIVMAGLGKLPLEVSRKLVEKFEALVREAVKPT
jgi:hypothetical protein